MNYELQKKVEEAAYKYANDRCSFHTPDHLITDQLAYIAGAKFIYKELQIALLKEELEKDEA